MSVVLFKRKLTNFLPCEQNSLRSCKRNEEEKTRELSRKIDWNRICSRGTNLFRQRKVEFSAQLYARPSKINAVHKSNIICGNIDASNADIDNPTKKKKKLYGDRRNFENQDDILAVESAIFAAIQPCSKYLNLSRFCPWCLSYSNANLQTLCIGNGNLNLGLKSRRFLCEKCTK